MNYSIARKQRAFTLIELLVVILIIAILVAVALPNFLGQQNKANDSSAVQKRAVAQRTIKAATINKDRNIPTDLFAQSAASETGLFEELTDINDASAISSTAKVYVYRASDSSATAVVKSKSQTYFCTVTNNGGQTFVDRESKDFTECVTGSVASVDYTIVPGSVSVVLAAADLTSFPATFSYDTTGLESVPEPTNDDEYDVEIVLCQVGGSYISYNNQGFATTYTASAAPDASSCPAGGTPVASSELEWEADEDPPALNGTDVFSYQAITGSAVVYAVLIDQNGIVVSDSSPEVTFNIDNAPDTVTISNVADNGVIAANEGITISGATPGQYVFMTTGTASGNQFDGAYALCNDASYNQGLLVPASGEVTFPAGCTPPYSDWLTFFSAYPPSGNINFHVFQASQQYGGYGPHTSVNNVSIAT